jgi:molecular chaperone GrpE
MEENNNQNPIEEKIAGELEEVDEVRDEKKKLEKCEIEKGEYLAGWQRAKADFINYKKDEIKRLEEFAKYSSEELIRELIGIMDNFDLGLAALEKSGPVEKGIYMIRNQIDDILKKRGLEKISIKPGEDFNPSLAEAMSETESKYPPGTIAEEIEPGYKIYEKIIRPARVKLSKGQTQ